MGVMVSLLSGSCRAPETLPQMRSLSALIGACRSSVVVSSRVRGSGQAAVLLGIHHRVTDSVVVSIGRTDGQAIVFSTVGRWHEPLSVLGGFRGA
jgi:hypothetical protein